MHRRTASIAPAHGHVAVRVRVGVQAAVQVAVQVAAWLVLAGLGRQHQALWASGLLPLALWLAAGAALHSPALAALAHGLARLGPVALVVLAACLWGLPHAPGPALLGMALAWAVLGLAVRPCQPARTAAPHSASTGQAAHLAWLPVALGGALGLVVGAGPLLQGATAAWVPAALLLAALLWLPAAGRTGGRGAARPAAPVPARAAAPAPALAPAPAAHGAAQPPPWRWRCVRAASWLAMVSMMATLPWLLDNCRTDQLPAWAMLALHGLVMLLPAGAWGRRRHAGPGHQAAAWLLLAGGAALWWLPGGQGPMLGGLLQAAAWRQTQLAWPGSGPAPLAPSIAAARPASVAAGLCTAACVLAIGLALAQIGTPAIWLLHSLLAVAGAATLCPQGWLRRAAPRVSPWPAGWVAGRQTPPAHPPSAQPPRG